MDYKVSKDRQDNKFLKSQTIYSVCNVMTYLLGKFINKFKEKSRYFPFSWFFWIDNNSLYTQSISFVVIIENIPSTLMRLTVGSWCSVNQVRKRIKYQNVNRENNRMRRSGGLTLRIWNGRFRARTFEGPHYQKWLKIGRGLCPSVINFQILESYSI